MGRKCVIKNCANAVKNPTGTIFTFPKDTDRRDKWIEFTTSCETNIGNPINFGICELHFSDNDYRLTGGKNGCKRKLHTFAIPSIKRLRPIEIKECHDEDSFLNMKKYVEHLENELTNARKVISEKVYKITQLESKIKEQDDILTSIRNDMKETCISNELMGKIKQIFSPSQLSWMDSGKKFVKWGDEDMTRFISLYSVSSRAFCYLRDVCSFPLPSERTIQLWLSKVKLTEGIIQPVMSLLSVKFKDSKPLDRKCILALDEMNIDDRYCYDSNEDRILGGNKNLMTFSIRGLFKPWKQIVGYTFDGKITPERLNDMIIAIHKTGLDVVGIVHDLSTKNQGLLKELQTCRFDKLNNLISSYFINPVTNKRVYVFPDFPHLVKLLRNHFMDKGFTLKSGLILNKSLIQSLLSAQDGELKLTFKITEKDVNVRKKERQNVGKAWKIFSHTVSKAIELLFPWRKQEAEFFQLINDLCDILNVRDKGENSNPYKCAYGKHLEEQKKKLDEAYEVISQMKVGTRTKSLAPFQKGFMISITSLKGLFDDMKKDVESTYILTSHVNQDYLESLFSRLRGIGGFNLTPTAVDVKARLKRVIFSWNFLSPRNSSVKINPDDVCISASMLSALMNTEVENVNTPLIDDEQLERILDIVPEIEVSPIDKDNMTISEKSKKGGEEYVAGCIAKKLLDTHPELSAFPFDRQDSFWVDLISEGKLTEPSSIWLATFEKFELWFQAYHGTRDINRKPNVVKNLSQVLITNYPEVPEKAIKLYVKTRTHIKIKEFNKNGYRHIEVLEVSQQEQHSESEDEDSHDRDYPEIDQLEDLISSSLNLNS